MLASFVALFQIQIFCFATLSQGLRLNTFLFRWAHFWQWSPGPFCGFVHSSLSVTASVHFLFAKISPSTGKFHLSGDWSFPGPKWILCCSALSTHCCPFAESSLSPPTLWSGGLCLLLPPSCSSGPFTFFAMRPTDFVTESLLLISHPMTSPVPQSWVSASWSPVCNCSRCFTTEYAC